MQSRSIIFSIKKIELLTKENYEKKKRDFAKERFVEREKKTEKEIEKITIKIYKKRKERINWFIESTEKEIKKLKEDIAELEERKKSYKSQPAQVFKIFLLMRRF